MTHVIKASAIALILSAGLATPAMADVQLVGNVVVDKNIDITVDTFKDKNVDINVDFDAVLDGSAQSNAIVNATIDSVDIGPINDGVTDEGIDKEANTDNSVNANTGIVQFNQDAGQTTNQGNVVSAAVVFSGEEDSQVVMSEAYVDQRISNSDATHQESAANLGGLLDENFEVDLDGDFEYDLTATITDSYNGNTGIVQGNQNVGNANNQHNVLSAAVGDNALVALSDAGLGQENSGNTLLDINTLKTSVVSNSMNGNAGVVSVNQASGAFNNQATVISIAALSSAVGLGQ